MENKSKDIKAGEEWKAARAAYMREWADKNREQRNAYQREWAKKNPDKRREYRKRWFEKKAVAMGLLPSGTE